MNNIKIIEQDIIFLSYDEPNAEKNYADLCSKAPWAKRVHGVKGSDAAHKACAALSDTEYFVTVDADNIVDADFFKVEIDLNELGLTSENVFSWCGSVHVNGLRYGNGGLKLWTRTFVNEMRTHENSDPTDVKSVVEFCFDSRYYQFNDCYSESYTNASPFQAWRAGFREGVKMSLDQGAKTVDIKSVWWQNYHRLLIWSSVGADVSNGMWSMLGAQEGAYLTNCTEWDYANVRDFDYLTDYWKTTHATASAADTSAYLNLLGESLRTSCKLEISNLDAAGSTFFKTVYNNTPRIVRKR
jgi:hypothetical protein